MKLKLFTDGGSRGNPGPAAYGYVIYDVTDIPATVLPKSGAGIILEKCGNYIGITTNNQAEYAGLVSGLGWVLKHHPTATLEIFLDSLLVVNQIKGLFKIKNAGLLPKYQEVRGLLHKLSGYSISYIPRAQNALADSLVNEALDTQQSIS